MEGLSTEYVIVEELPTVELVLLDSTQNNSERLCVGPLQVCRIQVTGTFFLCVPPEFRYVLRKSIQVLRAKDKRYILPTNQRGIMYGITVIDPVKEQIELLDVVLEDNCEFIIHKLTLSDSVSSAAAKGGSWLARGLRRSVELAAVGYAKGKEKIGKMMEDRRERKKQAARARVEAKSAQSPQFIPMPAVASMLSTSQAISATGVDFAPEMPSAPPAEPEMPPNAQAKPSAAQSVKKFADKIAQEQLGLRNSDDLVAGLRLLGTTATVLSKYIDPQSALRFAAKATQLIVQPRPAN